MRTFILMAIAIMMVAGAASATYLPHQTAGTQQTNTYISLSCDGTVWEKEQASIVATSADTSFQAPLSNGETVSISAHSQSLLAGHGTTELEKTLSLDSSNVIGNVHNIESATALRFDGNGAIFRESILEEGVSTGDETTIEGDKTLCVFAEPNPESVIYPAFCNHAMAQTRMMVSSVDMHSNAGTRSIVPTYDTGATLDYRVTATGEGAINVRFDSLDIESRTASRHVLIGTPGHYTPEQYAPSQYTPSQYTPEQYAPSQYTPGQYTPSSYVNGVYTPESYTPGQYTPESYTPSQYTPSSYSPEGYTPSTYVPEHIERVILPANPSAITEYRESTTAVGTWDLTNIVSYRSSIRA